MYIKKFLLFTVMGAFLGLSLRLADFLLFYDAPFLTQGGVLSFIGLGCMALCLVPGICRAVKSRNCGCTYVPARSIPRGLVTLLAAAAALYAALKMFQTYQAQMVVGIKEYSATGLSMRLPFLVMTAVLGIYLLFAAALHLAGKETLFVKAKLLELIPVLWGLVYVLHIFVHYSVAFMLSENIFVIVAACALVLALTGKAKHLSAATQEGKGFFSLGVTASLAVMLSSAYAGSNAIYGLLHMRLAQSSELPAEVQLIVSCMSLLVFVFVATAKNEDMVVATPENHQAKRYR